MFNRFRKSSRRKTRRSIKRRTTLGFLQALESRQLLANGVIDDMGNSVPADFTVTVGPLSFVHSVIVTSVVGDADNDGNVTTPNLTLNGEISGPNADDFTDTHAALVLTAFDANTNAVLGTTSTFVAAGGGAVTFSLPVTLPNVDGDYEVRFEIARAGFPAEDIVRVDNNQPLQAEFTLASDSSEPQVTEVELSPAEPSQLPVAITRDTNPTFDFVLTEQRFELLDNTVTLELIELQNGGGERLVASKNVTIDAGADETVQVNESLTGSFDPGARRIVIRATDNNGNTADSDVFQFFVLVNGENTQIAPGTPVFSNLYDIQDLLPTPGDDEFPWQMVFDRTTQTLWFTLEHGNGVVQFDPATGATNVFDLNSLTLGVNDSWDNPHGIFFDFDSHNTPRVWFVHRNAGGQVAIPGSEGGPGRLTYLDIATREIVTYDFTSNPVLGTVEDFHAIVVDATGDVWVVADHGNFILQFDFDQGSNVDGRVGNVTLHPVPHDLVVHDGGGGAHNDFHPHGIKVVVDDKTGQQYVWFVSEGGSGQIALLRPGALNPGEDHWTTWGVPDELQGARGTFVEIDDNETPNKASDDRIVATFPVGAGTLNPNETSGVIYILDPGSNLVDPGNDAMPATLKAWQIARMPGNPPGLAAINQPYINREGNIFYVDRQSGVARFDSDVLSSFLEVTLETTVLTAISETFDGIEPSDIIPFDDVFRTFASSPLGAGPVEDRSPRDGLDQYEVARGSDNRGAGPFRGFLNAADVLYGSMTQSDSISVTIFAESARRQVAVVPSPKQLPPGATIEGRMVFQVLRDGSVVLTARGDGSLTETQVNLTNLLASKSGGFANININGDVTATIDGADNVYVYGRDTENGLVVYRFSGAAAWTIAEFANPNNWTVFKLETPADVIMPSEPTAFTDASGVARAVATTNEGHLLLFGSTPGATVVDLSDEAAMAQPVYASVAVVQHGGLTLAYGADQQGNLIEYTFDASDPLGAPITSRIVVAPSDSTRIFQEVTAIVAGDVIHVYAINGASELVHVEIDALTGVGVAENVTRLIQASGRAFGYFNFQADFVARVYTELTAEIGPDGRLFVYGTNGRDLIEFSKTVGGEWQAANLTNDILSTNGQDSGNNRIPANKVFGAPHSYVLPNGERHIFQINEDGDIVEYHFALGDNGQAPRFRTQNITLALGNSIPGLESTEAKIAKLYNQILARNPDDAGLEFFANAVNNGATLGDVAQALLDSTERLDPIIEQMYEDYLSRPVDPAGLAYWRNVFIQTGGPDQVIAGLISSAEFFASAGGTNVGFVTELYQRLLGRAPDAEGLSHWTTALDTGALDRASVVLSFLKSDESFQSQVNQLFVRLLSRPAKPAELVQFTALLRGGVSPHDIQILIINSPEYLNT